MTGQDIIDRLNEMVDEKVGGNYPTEAEVLHWATRAQKTLARELLCYKQQVQDVTVATTTLYTNETDCIEIEQIFLLTGTGGTIDEVLTKTTLGALLTDNRDLSDTGEPTHWYPHGANQYGLWPIPDAVYYLTVQYAAMPSDLTTVSDSPVLPTMTHEAINIYCGYRFWLKEEEIPMAREYLNEFWSEVETLKGRLNPDGGVSHIQDVAGYV